MYFLTANDDIAKILSSDMLKKLTELESEEGRWWINADKAQQGYLQLSGCCVKTVQWFPLSDPEWNADRMFDILLLVTHFFSKELAW